MKIQSLILFVCAVGVLGFLGSGVFSGAPANDGARGKRSRSIAKFLSDRALEESRLTAAHTPVLQLDTRRLESEILTLKTLQAALRNLSGDELIEGWLELSVSSSGAIAIYPEYRSEKVQLGRALQEGFGPRHPKIVGLEMSIETKHAQLMEAVETYKNNLSAHIESAQKLLAETRRGKESPGR